MIKQISIAVTNLSAQIVKTSLIATATAYHPFL